MRIFKTKYRVYTYDGFSYVVERKLWYLPLWERLLDKVFDTRCQGLCALKQWFVAINSNKDFVFTKDELFE